MKVLLIVFLSLVFLAALYLGFRGYQITNERVIVFQNGANYGYEQAILQVMNLSIQCQPFPIFVGNYSVDLIAIDCLQG